MSDTLHPASLPLEQLRSECSIERVRRSGPGGQHRNKVETGIVLRHEPTGVRAEASERRSQAENLEVAWQRLRVQLALNVRQPSIGGKPSELWQSRVVGSKVSVNERHADFPALLAEALDVLTSVDWNDRDAANLLGVSRSQFHRFLQREPRAFTLLNTERAARGLAKLE